MNLRTVSDNFLTHTPQHLPLEVKAAMLGILLLLFIASLVTFLLFPWLNGDVRVELRRRVFSWWAMVLLFGSVLLTSYRATVIFFGFVSFLALKEYLSLIPMRRADRRVLFWVYLTVVVQYYFVYINWYGMCLVFIPVYMLFWIPVRMVTIGQTDGFLKAVSSLQWGLMSTVFGISHLPLLMVRSDYGYQLVVYLVFLTQFNDVAQYVVGRCFGKEPIAPKVSPNKTVAGLMGGLVVTTGLSLLIAPYLTPFYWPAALTAGLWIALGGFLGDLVISAIKRDLGTKDCSSIIPGHGGVLDRIDSLTLITPVFFHLYMYFWNL